MTISSETYAYYFVMNFDCPEEEISKKMGLDPTKSQRKGTQGTYVDQIPHGRWELHSALERNGTLLQDHIEALLTILEERASLISELAQQFQCGLNCVGYYYGSNPGLHLSERLIQRLGKLGLAVDFDIYNYREREKDPPSAP